MTSRLPFGDSSWCRNTWIPWAHLGPVSFRGHIFIGIYRPIDHYQSGYPIHQFRLGWREHPNRFCHGFLSHDSWVFPWFFHGYSMFLSMVSSGNFRLDFTVAGSQGPGPGEGGQSQGGVIRKVGTALEMDGSIGSIGHHPGNTIFSAFFCYYSLV